MDMLLNCSFGTSSGFSGLLLLYRTCLLPTLPLVVLQVGSEICCLVSVGDRDTQVIWLILSALKCWQACQDTRWSRCWTRDTDSLSPRPARRRSMNWCWSAGVQSPVRGPLLRPYTVSWRTTLTMTPIWTSMPPFSEPQGRDRGGNVSECDQRETNLTPDGELDVKIRTGTFSHLCWYMKTHHDFTGGKCFARLSIRKQERWGLLKYKQPSIYFLN